MIRSFGVCAWCYGSGTGDPKGCPNCQKHASEHIDLLEPPVPLEMDHGDCTHTAWAWCHALSSPATPYAPEGSDIAYICEGCGLEKTRTEMDAWMPHEDKAQLTLW